MCACGRPRAGQMPNFGAVFGLVTPHLVLPGHETMPLEESLLSLQTHNQTVIAHTLSAIGMGKVKGGLKEGP